MKKLFSLVIFLTFLVNLSYSQYAAKITLVILPFDLKGSASGREVSWMRIGIPDQISTAFHHLYRHRIRLVERARLNDLLQEQQLSQAGFIDKNQMAEVGKFFAANFSVAGNVFCPDDQHLMITIKVIDTETSEYASVNYLTDLEKGIYTIGDSIVAKIYPEILRLRQEKILAREGSIAEKIPAANSVENQAAPKSENISAENIRLISAVSKAATSHFYSAVDFIRRQEWEKALLELKRSVQLDSSFARAYANLGAVYMNLGDFDRAKKSLETKFTKTIMPNTNTILIKYFFIFMILDFF